MEKNLLQYEGDLTADVLRTHTQLADGTCVMETIRGERGKGKKREFRVSWLGWPSEDDTWEPAEKIKKISIEMVKEFEQRRERLKNEAMVVS